MRLRALLIWLLAATAHGSPPRASYREHGGLAVAIRIGPGSEGRSRVSIEDRGSIFEAEVGRTAIVQVHDAGELDRAGLHLERWLMPSVGLALVTGAADEDGLDVAARLATSSMSVASPDLYLVRRHYDIRVPPDDARYN